MNLDSGESKVLCQGGVFPIWTKTPREQIIFVRGPQETARTTMNETLWRIDIDGSNLQEIAGGGHPSATDDGRLFFRSLSSDGELVFNSLSLHQQNSLDMITSLTGYPFSIYPAVSPDGMLGVFPTYTHLVVQRLETKQEIASVEIGSVRSAGWSPDGRYIAFGSPYRQTPALWLFEVSTANTRLLASLPVARPRWSPDGRFIAVDEQTKNEIVILDVSALDLKDGLPPARRKTDE